MGVSGVYRPACPLVTCELIGHVDFSAFIALSALPSSRKPMMAFSTVSRNSSSAVAHSAITSETTPATTRMIYMNVR